MTTLTAYAGPSFKPHYSLLHKLPEPSLSEKEKVTLYKKAPLIGQQPKLKSTLNVQGLNVHFTGNIKNTASKQYCQYKIDFLHTNAQELHCAVINSVSAFTKESALDSGIVVNFTAG
jgi:hypothetical protein